MNQDHIIQKVFVEITVNNREKAYRIKDDISSFLSVEIFPEIEKYLDTLEQKLSGQTLRIPKLEFTLDLNNGALNTEVKNTIIRYFKEEISGITRPFLSLEQETATNTEAYLVGNQEKIIQAFIYFLEHGSMPWWNPDKRGMNFLEPTVFKTMISADSFPKNILPVLPKQKVQDRIIYQLSDVQLAALCRAILKNKASEINLKADIIRPISRLTLPDRIMIWRIVLNVVIKYADSPTSNFREYVILQIAKVATAGLSQSESIHKNLQTIVKLFPFVKEKEIENVITKNLKDTQPNLLENSKPSAETIPQKDLAVDEEVIPDDGQYIQHAGLILIHPFIKTFFEHCGLLDPNTQQLLDPELSAHLLYYIATGKTNPPEYDMVFEKFLCNIPSHQSINRHIKLSRKHKTQAKNVIESILHNWSPMKKSSVGLLQNEFFQRPGKLVVTDYDYTLTVERKTQDILLDKLVWGIGLVKLPWKEKFIYVNW